MYTEKRREGREVRKKTTNKPTVLKASKVIPNPEKLLCGK